MSRASSEEEDRKGRMATSGLKEEQMTAMEASPLHVLAVDDSSVGRMMIEKLLNGFPYRVTTVDSGKRALELLEMGKANDGSSSAASDVNLILTDYCMPEMTGYDLLKRVKESTALRDIPVVIMSSENVPTRISRCMEEGAEDFLLKPLRPEDVSRIMKFVEYPK
ncbi:two-component response regulator ORR3-like [Wolffia australiana]